MCTTDHTKKILFTPRPQSKSIFQPMSGHYEKGHPLFPRRQGKWILLAAWEVK